MLLKNYIYNAKIKNIEDKIPDITTLNAKINEVKGTILNITNLATTTAFAAVENKVIYLKKLTITQKSIKLKRKLLIMITIYILTQEFNKVTIKNFAARLAKENLASKNHIAALVKKYIFMIN